MARFTVRVTPRGGRDAIDGPGADGVVRVRVRVAPTDGQANDAVLRLLGAALGVPPSTLIITAGQSSRTKVIDAPLLTKAQIQRMLGIPVD